MYLSQYAIVLIDGCLIQLGRILYETSRAPSEARFEDVLNKMVSSQVVP